MTDAVKPGLEKIDLGEYATVFAENDIDLDSMFDLTDRDLKELGVSLGHRKRLLRAISNDADFVAQGPLHAERDERRQLTVMFCDLVGSTGLSSRFVHAGHTTIIWSV